MTFSADKSPDRITPGKALEPVETSPRTPKDFRPFMEGSEGPMKGQAPKAASGLSPMDVAKQPPVATNVPSISTILAQSKTAQDTLGNVHKQLKTKDLTLRRSQAHLLKNKLTDAQGYLRGAGAKLGVETPAPEIPAGTSVLGRFIAYVDDGQNQLVAIQQKLKNMAANGETINAAEMLSVQVKMGLASQEIEYASGLLAKVVQSISTIMQMQL